MKKISIILILLILVSSFVYIADAQTFYFDVYNHWAEKDIYQATNVLKIFNGYGDWTFRPDRNISIGEYFKIIYKIGNDNNIIKLNTSGNLGYSDININHWAYTYILSVNNYMNQNNRIDYSIKDIFTGTRLNPDSPITRYQAALLTHILSMPPVNDAILPFTDIRTTNSFYNQIKDLYNNGIIMGYNDNEFRSSSNLTRAEAATLSKRIYDEALYFKTEYLKNIVYSNDKSFKEYPLFYKYDNKNLSNDDFNYIKAVTTLEYLAFGGYIFPEDEALYDTNPVKTLNELKDKKYFNTIGTNYYLLKNDNLDKNSKIQYSNIILDSMYENGQLSSMEKLTLLNEIIKNSVDEKVQDYFLDFKDSVSDFTIKSDIDFLLFQYYINNNKLSQLYETLIKYNNLSITSSSFVNTIKNSAGSIYTTNLSLNDQYKIIEKYILNITYCIDKIGFEKEAEDFIESYYKRLKASQTYKNIFEQNHRNITGTLKTLKLN
jgi:hypothetical protein